MSWTLTRPIRLAHTDCAGVVFFPRLLEIAHEAYETLLERLGLSLAAGVAGPGPLLPIARCEADYLRPLRLGERVEITLSLERLGERSFTLGYSFSRPGGEVVARARTVHVAIDRGSGASLPLDGGLRALLERLDSGEVPD